MKSSVLVPVILVVCLVALALLISQAFSAAQNRQVLTQDSMNNTSAPKSGAADSADIYDTQAGDEAGSDEEPAELVPATAPRNGSLIPANQDLTSEGEYLVIAGSFRQAANAQTRVDALRKAGFSTTEVSNFDRGTYAVALVGR